MRELWHKVRGYIAVGVALIACPCHLLITLPLLLALTAGTALGAFLGENTPLVFAASTLLFVGGLVLGFIWLNAPACTDGSRAELQAELWAREDKISREES